MNNSDLLKAGRDLLLKLHKILVDYERENYVSLNGPVTAGQFLNQLLENPDLGWLRRFSTLIVDIDEMFAQKDGFQTEAVDFHLAALRNLVSFETADEKFRMKYQTAIQENSVAAGLHADLKRLLTF